MKKKHTAIGEAPGGSVNVRRHDGSRAVRPAGDPWRQDEGMAERDNPGLPAAHEAGRHLARGRLSFEDEHALGASRVDFQL